MTHILFVGQQPETVDFSDPAIPLGFNAEKSGRPAPRRFARPSAGAAAHGRDEHPRFRLQFQVRARKRHKNRAERNPRGFGRCR
jgi:hypothetical protein